jgi:NAD-reducing hydrogenase small subunit
MTAIAAKRPEMTKPTLATCALTGCFGCHMSLLDIDERILELVDLVDLDVSPFDDKKTFDRSVDVGFIEGGCSNEYNVKELRELRKH